MGKRIKIVYVLEATSGGTRRHLFQILTQLDLKIFEPVLFCTVKRDRAFLNDLEKFRTLGIKIEIFPMKRAVSPLTDLWLILLMTRALHFEKPDIVHTHSSKAGFIGRLAAKRAGVAKIVHTPHVFPFEMGVSSLKKRIYLKLERMAAKWTDLLIAVSYSEKAVAVENGLFDTSKIIVNHNGVNPDLWRFSAEKRCEIRKALGISDDEFAVGMVGRFMPQKGYYLLLDAARMLLSRNKRFKFILIGDGELKPAIQYLTAAHKIDKHFCFVEQTDDVGDYYSSFDCLAAPSLWESCPYTIMESMATGIPVIASAVGGVNEIIEDRTSGLLVPGGTADQLAEAIEQLSANDDLRKELGENGRKRVLEKFLLADSIKRLEGIYHKLK